MHGDSPHILLVNPWIHDFAAYDFWARPMGILTLASILREHGFKVSYIDCLDRFHPKAPLKDPLRRHGCGPYMKETIAKPAGLEDVSRTFSRYGVKEAWIHEDLQSMSPPDLILVTSHMTYWYPGVQHTIAVIRKHFPDIPVVLGGIYASLCHDHAVKFSGADEVISGSSESVILDIARRYTGASAVPVFNPDDLDLYPFPAFDLQARIPYVTLLTSRGCPFSCSYCASGFLEKKYRRRTPQQVVDEIKYWYRKYHVREFAFYDDAFLVNSGEHAVPIMEKLIAENIDARFHTPNALHIREISQLTAGLMFRAGFRTLRLGLETLASVNREELDEKVTAEEFQRAAACLRHAGFKKDSVGAYLLTGLPGQETDAVKNSIQQVKQSGFTPILAYYTPIPHTDMWAQACASSRYDLAVDPIFTNNAIFPCRKEPFSWGDIGELKRLIRD